MSQRNLDFLLRPRSIAVVGEGSAAAAVLRNLREARFPGPLYEWRDAEPQPVDLAVLCTPPARVPGLVQSLGARAAAILADGVDGEAALAAAQPRLVRLLGPNSMGLLAPAQSLNASFAPTPAARGPLAFVSQSGALLAAALDWAAARGLGFTYAVSLGDAADVDAGDLLDFLASDPATRAILLYLESVRDGRKLLSAARAAARAKPVLAMKAGRTRAGAAAAAAHTGAEAGDDAVFDAAFERAGMLRVDTIAELFDAAETLGRARFPAAGGLAVVGNAGGPAVVAADAAAARGVALAGAPLDLGGDASAAAYAQALAAVSAQEALLVIHGPSGVTSAEAVARACAGDAAAAGRMLACWLGGERARRGAALLREAGVPVYETPEAAVQAFSHMLRYRRSQEALQEAPDGAEDFAPDEAAARRRIAAALDEGRTRLTDPEGKALLTAYGVPVVNTHVAADAGEAAKLAAEIGYPVALKVLSPDLEHRADVGGVVLNLESEAQLLAAARDIAARMRELRPQARLAGFTVQRMLRPPGAVHRRHGAAERRLQAARDPVFGMTLRLDGAVGLVPLNFALALDLVGRDDAEGRALAAVLERVSALLACHPEIAALEIDPLLSDAEGAMALEVRVRVARTPLAPGEHLAIRPYPRELESRARLAGEEVLLRPIRPEDAPAYARFIEGTGAEDLRMRFFTLARGLPAKDLARYTQIDYDREMAFVAVAPGAGGDILGEVRIFSFPDGATAEFAILVRSDSQRRGLGRALLGKAIAYARARGAGALIGQIRADNAPMLGLARACGMALEQAPGASVVVAHLALRA